jgi:hypothetical protein
MLEAAGEERSALESSTTRGVLPDQRESEGWQEERASRASRTSRMRSAAGSRLDSFFSAEAM